MKNNRLDFYIVKDQYIEYISKYDKHIAYNKKQQRPYIGIVLDINNFLYFAPMFSPKSQHLKYKDNLTFFKMFGNKQKSDYLGIIRFADMIPVPQNEIILLDAKEKGMRYNILLHKQYNYINKTKNRNIIRNKAKTLYGIIVSDKYKSKERFYKKLCCDFKLLEEKSSTYVKLKEISFRETRFCAQGHPILLTNC